MDPVTLSPPTIETALQWSDASGNEFEIIHHGVLHVNRWAEFTVLENGYVRRRFTLTADQMRFSDEQLRAYTLGLPPHIREEFWSDDDDDEFGVDSYERRILARAYEDAHDETEFEPYELTAQEFTAFPA